MNDPYAPPASLPSDDLCKVVLDLLPDYVLHYTTEDESRLIEACLPLCVDARQALEQYRFLGDGLLQIIPDAGAPPAVDRLFARLANDNADTGRSPATVVTAIPPIMGAPRPTINGKAQPSGGADSQPRREMPRHRAYRWQWLVAAIITVLLGLNVAWAIRTAQLQAQVGQLTEAVDHSLAAASLTDDSQYRPLKATTPDMAGVQAIFAWNPVSRIGVLYVTGMPALDSQHTYELWLVNDHTSESLGTFRSDAAGMGVLVFHSAHAVEGYKHIGINIEPGNGTTTPTTPHLILGNI